MSRQYPVRAGIFSTVDQTRSVLNQLHDAGFSWDEVSVVCSDETKEEMFPESVQKEPASHNASKMMDAAGAGLLGIGGAAVIAAMLSTAGTAVMILGAFAGVAAGGTFTALMATRGFESEATDYYEQAVQEGKILVAVEVDPDQENSEERLQRATQIIDDAGAESLRLAH